MVAESGFVGSEGFPSFYKPNSKCAWRITVSHSPFPKPEFSSFSKLSVSDSRCFPGPRGKRDNALLSHF